MYIQGRCRRAEIKRVQRLARGRGTLPPRGRGLVLVRRSRLCASRGGACCKTSHGMIQLYIAECAVHRQRVKRHGSPRRRGARTRRKASIVSVAQRHARRAWTRPARPRRGQRGPPPGARGDRSGGPRGSANGRRQPPRCPWGDGRRRRRGERRREKGGERGGRTMTGTRRYDRARPNSCRSPAQGRLEETKTESEREEPHPPLSRHALVTRARMRSEGRDSTGLRTAAGAQGTPPPVLQSPATRSVMRALAALVLLA